MLTFELLMVLPILLAVVWAVVEISLVLTARQKVAAACREGARVAAVGASSDEVAAVIQTVLGPKLASEATTQLATGHVSPSPAVKHPVVIVEICLKEGVAGPCLIGLGKQCIRVQSVMRKE